MDLVVTELHTGWSFDVAKTILLRNARVKD